MRHPRSISTHPPRSRLLASLAALVFAALLAAACGTTVPTVEPVRLTLAASSSALPLAETVASAYHGANPHAH